MSYTIHYSCVSDIGKRRAMNQDNFCCDGHSLDEGLPQPLEGAVRSKDARLFGVFDGMGGEEKGEVAARIAADQAVQLAIGRDPEADMLRLCREANAEICDYVLQNGLRSMGTTAAMLAFAPKSVALCNIGDSRVFRYTGGELYQISEDHVDIVPFGRKPPLLQNLGIPPDEMEIEPYVALQDYCDGDVYLICSDGLTDMVPEAELRRIVAETPFDRLTGALLERALEGGGVDNITVLACRVEKDPGGLLKRIFNLR